MKTARFIIGISLPFFLNYELMAQKMLDGRDVAIPDRNSFVEWLSNDGIFALVLVIGLVCLFMWLFYLAATFLISVEPAKGIQKNKKAKKLRSLRLSNRIS